MTTKIVVDDFHNDRLARMIRMQRKLQEETFGFELHEMNVPERVDYIKENVLALTDELHELLAETSWKPWAKSVFLNEEKAFSELVYVWHFMMNIMVAIAPDAEASELAEELASSYFKKREVNVQRQEDGYDGVSTKCPNCNRALDDIFATELSDNHTGPLKTVCAGCKTDVTEIYNLMTSSDLE